MKGDGSVYYHRNYSATENPEAFCRLVGEGCHDAHDRGEGFRKPGSQTLPPTSRMQCCMLHLVASDLNGNQVFGVGLKGYGPFLAH